MASKNCSLQGPSPRVCEDEVSDSEVCGKRSRIPKMPKRTFRVEGRGRSSKIRKSNSRCQNFTVSMIPRPDWKKCYKKSFTPSNSKTKLKTKKEEVQQQEEEEVMEEMEEEEKIMEKEGEEQVVDTKIASKCSSLESKINKDLADFKNNVLRIPEYWTDAGQTVTNVLKNAVNIVSRQYPSADVQNFEQEIQNILRATEAVKNKILTKTERIINEANKIYTKDGEWEDETTEDDTEALATTEEDIKSDENTKKNITVDALSSGDMKEINELEKAIKSKKDRSKDNPKNLKKNQQGGNSKRLLRKKSKLKLECPGESRIKGFEKNVNQSCGDVIEHEKTSSPQSPDSDAYDNGRSVKDKSSQTSPNWVDELMKKEEILAGLNNQILELKQLCQDHISKFRSFNLQIKLRGICNRAQITSASREIQILNAEKFKLAEKNSKLHFYNKDLESTIKQKEQDLHQKDRLITQQKKLLSVRDELIEMLKSKCKIQELDNV